MNMQDEPRDEIFGQYEWQSWAFGNLREDYDFADVTRGPWPLRMISRQKLTRWSWLGTGQSEERMELVGERSMSRREWLWKKNLLSRLPGHVFIVICSDQLLGAGITLKRGGIFYSILVVIWANSVCYLVRYYKGWYHFVLSLNIWQVMELHNWHCRP